MFHHTLGALGDSDHRAHPQPGAGAEQAVTTPGLFITCINKQLNHILINQAIVFSSAL